MNDKITKAAKLIKDSDHITVFTGAGISVESGIPPFRGEDGVWNKYDPGKFSIDYFYENPEHSWKLIKEVFYKLYKETEANKAHKILAEWEEKGVVNSVITQNIDGLHQRAGSKEVYEFHGTTSELVCLSCHKKFNLDDKEDSLELLTKLPPKCPECSGILKPNFIFFGEGIPKKAYKLSLEETKKADLFLVIGTTGEVMPAALIPQEASSKGAEIVEINVKASNYTNNITDIFLKGKATKVMENLNRII